MGTWGLTSLTMKSAVIPLVLIAGCVMLLVSMWTTKKLNGSLLDELQRSRAEMQIAVENSETCGRDLNSKTEDAGRKLREIENLKKEVAKVNGETSKIRLETEDSRNSLAQEKAEKQKIVEQNASLQKQANEQNLKLQKLVKEIELLEAANVKLAKDSEEADKKMNAMENAKKAQEEADQNKIKPNKRYCKYRDCTKKY